MTKRKDLDLQARQAANRLLAAVDRAIAATDAVRRARAALDRTTGQRNRKAEMQVGVASAHADYAAESAESPG